MIDEYWNVEQVLGWLAWGERAPISKLENDVFDRELVIEEESEWDRPHKPLQAWCDDLINRLRQGCFSVTGRLKTSDNEETSEERQIPREEWNSLILYGVSGAFNNAPPRTIVGFRGDYFGQSPSQEYNEACRAGTALLPSVNYPRWVDLRFRVAEVKKQIPPRSLQTNTAEEKCQAWLEGLMRQSHKSGKPKSEYLTKAQGLFGVSRRGFGRAWDGAIKVTGATGWSKAGRKS